MKKLCTIGSATQDIFIEYEGVETTHLRKDHTSRAYILLEQGIKADVSGVFRAVGGGAANAACSLVRLGLEVEALFARGDDEVGRFIVQHLTKEGIGLDYHVVKKEAQSAVSFIIPSPEKNSVALCYRGATRTLQANDIKDSFFNGASAVYITALSGASSTLLPLIVSKAREHKSAIAVNPGMYQLMYSAEFIEALADIDILIMNKREAVHLMKRLTGKEIDEQPLHVVCQGTAPELLRSFATFGGNEVSLYDCLGELFRHGPSIVVITNGLEGVYVGTPSTVYFHPSMPVNVVTALGAGDAFGSTFVGSLVQEKTLEEALVSGVINASSVIERRDAQTGLLEYSELQSRLAYVGNRYIQSYNFFQ